MFLIINQPAVEHMDMPASVRKSFENENFFVCFLWGSGGKLVTGRPDNEVGGAINVLSDSPLTIQCRSN